jgi:signal transduction histidine kinase
MKDLAQLAHDLRSPLARAKTIAKLLNEATEAERAELQKMLLVALEDLDRKIGELVK